MNWSVKDRMRRTNCRSCSGPSGSTRPTSYAPSLWCCVTWSGSAPCVITNANATAISPPAPLPNIMRDTARTRPPSRALAKRQSGLVDRRHGLTPGQLTPHRRDRVRDSDRAPGHVGVQPLHHLAVELDRTARGVLRSIECRDDLAGMRDLLRRRRKDRVAGHDLARMDQGLAVEAEIAGLRTFQREAVGIAEVAVGSVEDFDAVGAGRKNAVPHQGVHRRAARLYCYPRLP